MAERAALRVSASIAALVAAVASTRPAAALDQDSWVPALAAIGDAVARSDQRPEPADAIVVPVLVAVGVDAAAAAGAVADVGAAPASEARDETERWVPAFAFTSGMLGQNGEGRVSSASTLSYTYFAQDTGILISHNRPFRQSPVLAPLTTVITRSLAEGKTERFTTASNQAASLITGVLPSREQALPAAGKDLFLTPTVGASIELMTPGLQSVPLKPRVFLHGDATLAFSFNRDVAREGVPDGAEIPVPVPPVYSETQVKGVGSKVEGQVKTLVLSGGLGTALNVVAWERPLRIKPSFEFLRQEVDITGAIYRAFRKDTGLRQVPLTNTSNPPTPPFPPPLTTTAAPAAFIPFQVEANDTKTYYGIGPGLEVEMDAARAGPVMLTVFLSGQAYKMLGDLNVKMDATETISDPAIVDNTAQGGTCVTGSCQVSADFDFNMHSWAYRGGVGLRFRWLPED